MMRANREIPFRNRRKIPEKLYFYPPEGRGFTGFFLQAVNKLKCYLYLNKTQVFEMTRVEPKCAMEVTWTYLLSN